jgi:hypothetical protein
MYMRKVYLAYRDTHDKSIIFQIYVNADLPHGYLVRHHRRGGEGGRDFWSVNHAFRVHADVEIGDYRSECWQWEHTGMLILSAWSVGSGQLQQLGSFIVT